jgi:hypothetical protein
MTTNRIPQLLPLAATCLLFTSCIDSKVPLSDPNKLQGDERLAGNWQLRNDKGSVNSYRFDLVGGRLPASVMRVTGSSDALTIGHGSQRLLAPLCDGSPHY